MFKKDQNDVSEEEDDMLSPALDPFSDRVKVKKSKKSSEDNKNN